MSHQFKFFKINLINIFHLGWFSDYDKDKVDNYYDCYIEGIPQDLTHCLEWILNIKLKPEANSQTAKLNRI